MKVLSNALESFIDGIGRLLVFFRNLSDGIVLEVIFIDEQAMPLR